HVDQSLGYFAHMDPLQFWAEMGIAAPLLFYAILISILLRTIRAMRAAGDDVARRAEILGPFCALLAVTLHTHISFHLYLPCTLIVLGCFLAYWMAATSAVLPDDKISFLRNRRATKMAAFAAMLAILLSASWITRASLGIHY